LRHARKLKKIKDYIEIKLLQEVFFLVFMTEMTLVLKDDWTNIYPIA